MTVPIERRFREDSGLELRDNGEGPGTLEGHAAVFDSLSQDLGGFVERVAPGAFAETLSEDVRALFNHDRSALLGRASTGTLRLAVDSNGLAYEVDLPETSLARDVAELAGRGDLRGSSFGFVVRDDTWEEMDDGTIVRTLLSVRLYDVGPVTEPAYLETEAPGKELALRSLGARLGREIEDPREAARSNRSDNLTPARYRAHNLKYLRALARPTP